MGEISNINNFNEHRRNLVKLKTINDEIIISSKAEIKEILYSYISDELDLFDSISKIKRDEIDKKISQTLKLIETDLVAHMDEKINKCFERILPIILDRKIEDKIIKTINKRLKSHNENN